MQKKKQSSGSSPVDTACIEMNHLKNHVYELADDKMQGRQSGSEGAQKAARYIAEQFYRAGLKGIFEQPDPYFQKFRMERKKAQLCRIYKNDTELKNWRDFMEIYSEFEGIKNIQLVFLGYGQKKDYENRDVQGKIAVILSGKPGSKKSDRQLDIKKTDMARDFGAAGIIIIPYEEQEFSEYIQKVKPYIPSTRYYLAKNSEQKLSAQRNITALKTPMAGLLGMEPQDLYKPEYIGHSVNVTMESLFEPDTLLSTENILGKISGTDSPERYIILTAHYDGRGMDGRTVLNGANDNATGVAAMLELARCFSAAAQADHRPKCSIIFMMPAAEELLALGSSFYANNPAVPLDHTMLNINMDPLGREDVSNPDVKNHLYIYCSPDLNPDIVKIKQDIAEKWSNRLDISKKENYQGSDHINFELKGIPAIALTTGDCADHHGPGDDAEKVDYEKLQRVTELIYELVWGITGD
ncbi:M28 family peptidase [candidate division KSB1 bacterium]|nr:M28 family peptidase [candidate division KSB1 bacterium]